MKNKITGNGRVENRAWNVEHQMKNGNGSVRCEIWNVKYEMGDARCEI